MLIDVTRLAARALQGRLPTGVDRVSLAYIAHYRTRAHALIRYGGRWIEFGSVASHQLFDVLLDPVQVGASIRHMVAKAYLLEWRKAEADYLLNTGHSGLEHLNYIERVRRRKLRPLFFLHDLIPISHPEYCRPGEADKHVRRLTAIVSLAHGLVLNSAATLAELKTYAESNGIPLPPCAVIPLAPATLSQAPRSRPMAEPYFIILGTIEPRKNHLLLLNLWRQLALEHGDRAPRLVVIGQRGWECEQVIDMLDRAASIKRFVVELPRVNDGQLANWLHHAQALLFPTFAEGFGMPLVEALKHGVPVIASDLPVFREIGGNIPEYLDPIDGRAWKRAVLNYTQDDGPMRHAQLQRMKNFQASTWEQHFVQVDEFLRGLDG